MMKKPSYIFNESYTTTEGTRAYRLVMGFNSLKDMEEAFELIMSGKLFQKPPENPVLDANRCRIARMKNGQSYPKSSCEQCGTLMRPGWKCAMGLKMTSVSCHVICWEGPEWCVPQLIVEGPLQKANKIVEEMNRSEEAKQGLGWPELSCFVVKSNIQKVVV